MSYGLKKEKRLKGPDGKSKRVVVVGSKNVGGGGGEAGTEGSSSKGRVKGV